MQIENQVCLLEQAMKFKSLGVFQKSLFHHGLSYNGDGHDNVIRFGEAKEFKRFQFAAYTVAELGAMLPCGYDTMNTTHEGWNGYGLDGGDCIPGKTGFNNEAEARASMLIYLLENKLTTVEEVNARLQNS